MKRFMLIPLLLLALLGGPALADYTGFSSIRLQPTGSDSAILVQNAAGTITYFSVSAAGVANFAGGVTGDDMNATDDVTAGDDVVAGGMVTSAEKLQLDKGGTGTQAHIEASGVAGDATTKIDMGSNALAVYVAASPASGASVKQFEVTSTTATFIIPPTSAPSQTSSTAPGLLWLHNATANNGCGGACTNHKLYQFINGAWAVVGP